MQALLKLCLYIRKRLQENKADLKCFLSAKRNFVPLSRVLDVYSAKGISELKVVVFVLSSLDGVIKK